MVSLMLNTKRDGFDKREREREIILSEIHLLSVKAF